MKDIMIPVDKQIQEFRNHIIANPRTFLSSKFGDGKSYFIEKVKETLKDEFVFLTIYPVNYQVAANDDIFNFIKRDILFQMMYNNMIPEDVNISNDVALWGYIQNKGKSIISDLLPYLSSLSLPAEYVPVIAEAMKALNVFKDLKQKFEEYKKSLDAQNNILDDFIGMVDNKSLYEEDLVTTIIKESIRKYKEENKGKKIVFVIEDLDRIDPAHLFRILNIFSAHIDYSYKLGVVPNHKDVIGNKFGFDNVVFMADFNNVRKIFKHFYGEQTDFSGYIGKFLSSVPYEYSLRQVRINYIYDYLQNKIQSPRNLVASLITEEAIDTRTIRECIQAFDISYQITKAPAYVYDEGEIHLDQTILRILSVMRRLKISDEDIISVCSDLFNKEENLFCKFVAPYMPIRIDEYKSKNERFVVSFYVKEDPNQDIVIYRIPINPETGQGGMITRSWYQKEVELTDFSQTISLMLEYIVK